MLLEVLLSVRRSGLLREAQRALLQDARQDVRLALSSPAWGLAQHRKQSNPAAPRSNGWVVASELTTALAGDPGPR
jgi:hypothetical protein